MGFGCITSAFGNNRIGTMIYMGKYIRHDYRITTKISTNAITRGPMISSLLLERFYCVGLWVIGPSYPEAETAARRQLQLSKHPMCPDRKDMVEWAWRRKSTAPRRPSDPLETCTASLVQKNSLLEQSDTLRTLEYGISDTEGPAPGYKTRHLSSNQAAGGFQ